MPKKDNAPWDADPYFSLNNRANSNNEKEVNTSVLVNRLYTDSHFYKALQNSLPLNTLFETKDPSQKNEKTMITLEQTYGVSENEVLNCVAVDINRNMLLRELNDYKCDVNLILIVKDGDYATSLQLLTKKAGEQELKLCDIHRIPFELMRMVNATNNDVKSVAASNICLYATQMFLKQQGSTLQTSIAQSAVEEAYPKFATKNEPFVNEHHRALSHLILIHDVNSKDEEVIKAFSGLNVDQQSEFINTYINDNANKRCQNIAKKLCRREYDEYILAKENPQEVVPGEFTPIDVFVEYIKAKIETEQKSRSPERWKLARKLNTVTKEDHELLFPEQNDIYNLIVDRITNLLTKLRAVQSIGNQAETFNNTELLISEYNKILDIAHEVMNANASDPAKPEKTIQLISKSTFDDLNGFISNSNTIIQKLNRQTEANRYLLAKERKAPVLNNSNIDIQALSENVELIINIEQTLRGRAHWQHCIAAETTPENFSFFSEQQAFIEHFLTILILKKSTVDIAELYAIAKNLITATAFDPRTNKEEPLLSEMSQKQFFAMFANKIQQKMSTEKAHEEDQSLHALAIQVISDAKPAFEDATENLKTALRERHQSVLTSLLNSYLGLKDSLPNQVLWFIDTGTHLFNEEQNKLKTSETLLTLSKSLIKKTYKHFGGIERQATPQLKIDFINNSLAALNQIKNKLEKIPNNTAAVQLLDKEIKELNWKKEYQSYLEAKSELLVPSNKSDVLEFSVWAIKMIQLEEKLRKISHWKESRSRNAIAKNDDEFLFSEKDSVLRLLTGHLNRLTTEINQAQASSTETNDTSNFFISDLNILHSVAERLSKAQATNPATGEKEFLLPKDGCHQIFTHLAKLFKACAEALSKDQSYDSLSKMSDVTVEVSENYLNIFTSFMKSLENYQTLQKNAEELGMQITTESDETLSKSLNTAVVSLKQTMIKRYPIVLAELLRKHLTSNPGDNTFRDQILSLNTKIDELSPGTCAATFPNVLKAQCQIQIYKLEQLNGSQSTKTILEVSNRNLSTLNRLEAKIQHLQQQKPLNTQPKIHSKDSWDEAFNKDVLMTPEIHFTVNTLYLALELVNGCKFRVAETMKGSLASEIQNRITRAFKTYNLLPKEKASDNLNNNIFKDICTACSEYTIKNVVHKTCYNQRGFNTVQSAINNLEINTEHKDIIINSIKLEANLYFSNYFINNCDYSQNTEEFINQIKQDITSSGFDKIFCADVMREIEPLKNVFDAYKAQVPVFIGNIEGLSTELKTKDNSIFSMGSGYGKKARAIDAALHSNEQKVLINTLIRDELKSRYNAKKITVPTDAEKLNFKNSLFTNNSKLKNVLNRSRHQIFDAARTWFYNCKIIKRFCNGGRDYIRKTNTLKKAEGLFTKNKI